jgi:hypothetical protein
MTTPSMSMLLPDEVEMYIKGAGSYKVKMDSYLNDRHNRILRLKLLEMALNKMNIAEKIRIKSIQESEPAQLYRQFKIFG